MRGAASVATEVGAGVSAIVVAAGGISWMIANRIEQRCRDIVPNSQECPDQQ